MSVRALRRGTMAGRGAAPAGNVAYLALTGAGSNYASTPDSPANSITGDIDIRVKAAPADWTPTGTKAFITKYGSSSLSWRFYIASTPVAGRLSFTVSVDGTATVPAVASANPGFTDGTAHWVRVTRVASTGVVQFYTSEDGVGWSQLGTDVSTAASNIFGGTNPVEIGSYGSGLSQVFTGNIYYAELRDGIDGTVIHTFDPTGVTRLGTRDPSTVAAGGPWTMTGTAWDWVLA